MQPPRVSLHTFGRLSAGPVVAYALLVVTGGAVRLTGSGLGCPDWPTCSQHHLSAALSIHPLIEFGNRLVTVAVSALSVLVFLAALAVRPKRRDLVWLSAGLVIGLAAQVVLGGLVVLFKLNPYLVALHFVLTLVVLGAALLLRRRATTQPAPGAPGAAGELVWLGRLQLTVLSVVILAGTLVSGAGPHAGATRVDRVDIAFRDIAELHSTIALFLIGLTLGTLFALHVSRAPAVIQRRGRTMLEIYAVQGVLGFTQYFLHDAAGVVEIHLAGATAAFVATFTYYLELSRPAVALARPASSRRVLWTLRPARHEGAPS